MSTEGNTGKLSPSDYNFTMAQLRNIDAMMDGAGSGQRQGLENLAKGYLNNLNPSINPTSSGADFVRGLEQRVSS